MVWPSTGPAGLPRSMVSIGDSFSEGLSDPYPDGSFRGWADLVAAALTRQVPGFRYANLAVRGDVMSDIRTEQIPLLAGLAPELVTICAGGNDVLIPGTSPDTIATRFREAVATITATGARVLIFLGMDTKGTPLLGQLRGKIATYNSNLRSIADQYDAPVVDLWSMPILADRRCWSVDRLHPSPEGHRRIAARTLEVLGAQADTDWRRPLPAEAARSRADRLRREWNWMTDFVLPWIGRQLTGRSSGDGVVAKRPRLEPLTAAQLRAIEARPDRDTSTERVRGEQAAASAGLSSYRPAPQRLQAR